jgi:hypothetical protein
MKSALSLILFLSTFFSTAQSFEGVVVYKTSFDYHPSEKMIKMGITKELLAKKMKEDDSWSDSAKTIYKGGNYITYTNFNRPTYSIYRAAENKLYSFSDGATSDVCMVTDASIDTEYKLTRSNPIITKLDTTIDINGLSCSIVRVKWRSGTCDYYFHAGTLTVDATLFEKHVYDGWASYLKIAHALPVRIVKSTGMTTIIFTLSRQRAEPVDDMIFGIPTLVADKDLNLAKMNGKEMMRIKK